MRGLTRREFLKHGFTGLVLAGMSLGMAGRIPQVGAAAMDTRAGCRLFGVDEEMVRKTLDAALSRGGDYADLFFELTTRTVTAMEDNAVNSAFVQASLGMGARVVKGDRTGYSFTEEITLENMQRVARTAAGIASGTGRQGPRTLEPVRLPSFYPVVESWNDVSIEQRVGILQLVNQETLRLDHHIVSTQMTMLDEERFILVATSHGELAADHQPSTSCSASCVAEKKGRRESGHFKISARQGVSWYTNERLLRLAEEAVTHTLFLFDAVPAPAGEMPVVLGAGSSGVLLHEAIGHGMEADFNRKGISIFADKIGKKVAEPFVSIVDDGTVAHDRGAINVDDEGVPGRRTVLVEGGILKSYLHDRISAGHYGIEPTGNGRRQSYKHAPTPRMRNTYMLDGPHTREEIIGSTRQGIYVDRFTGGQVEIGAGDFTFYVKSGYLIEGGKLTRPIKDINIIGNGPDILGKITMVANDLKLSDDGGYCGKNGQTVPVSLGMPTCKVSSMTVGGRNA